MSVLAEKNSPKLGLSSDSSCDERSFHPHEAHLALLSFSHPYGYVTVTDTSLSHPQHLLDDDLLVFTRNLDAVNHVVTKRSLTTGKFTL